MSLIALAGLLWAATAQAAPGTVLTLSSGGVDADAVSDRGVMVAPEVVAPDTRWTVIDEHAMRNLGEELLAVRPLMFQFDGELEIMARLEAAIGNVHVVRNEEEKRLLYVALAFEGFAVERYFQSELATDPTAEPYRVAIGDHVEVKAWVDAVALDPYREPTRLDISEQPELQAFQAARDRLLYLDRAHLALEQVPPGAEVLLDGVKLAGPWTHVPVQPGRHLLDVQVDGAIVGRQDFRVGPGDEWRYTVPPPMEDLDTLAATLKSTPADVRLPPRIASALADLPPPVHLAVAGADGPVLYRVDGDRAVRVTAQKAQGGHAFAADLRTYVGAAWVHDASYYVLNENGSDGAPDTYGTENAGAPSLGASALWHASQLFPKAKIPASGDYVVGGGLDLLVPTGAWHHLDVDGRDIRLRAHPYLAVGLPQVQVTLGAITPWHGAFGARVALPVVGSTDLTAGFVQGLVSFRPELDGVDSEPLPPRMAFVGLSSAIGK